ncbi:MAG: hypothetical protein COB17_03670 [Sulfurimonas sp.]|nr:MAG: hypothetical protein COB17_03670 [Sulfurimonas sp.]
MTKRICLLTLLLTSSLFSVEIPTSHAQEKVFGKSVELNAQIIQLSNAGQSVTSLVSGHLEKYFVEPGQKVKAGQKVALIESILVSKMTANYISLNKQYISLDENYQATKKLYNSGMTSMQNLNNLSIQKNAMLAQINSLKSQLDTLGIDTKKLSQATANFILYAHSSGRVSALLQQLHTVVRIDEAIITIVKEQAFYIKSFVPLEYASAVKVGQKMIVDYNNRDIVTHVTQVLPSLDELTQRIVVLSSVDEKADDLFINSYVKSTLYFEAEHKHIAVLKSALSFFNNEWVIFMPTKHDEEEKHDEHGQEDEHDEHESPYEARVVEIVASDDKYVGVKGIEANEEYVSAKSYYVKSMMLKSSLGEHGH